MLTTTQQQELNDFNDAKKIALSMPVNHYRRASVENLFHGANLNGLGTVVMWLESEKQLTNAKHTYKIELDKQIFLVRKVAEYTILD